MPSAAQRKQEAKASKAADVAKNRAKQERELQVSNVFGSQGRRDLQTQVLRVLEDDFPDFEDFEIYKNMQGDPPINLYTAIEALKKEKNKTKGRISPAMKARLRALYKVRKVVDILRPSTSGEAADRNLKVLVAKSMVTSTFERDRDSLYHYLRNRDTPLTETEFLIIVKSVLGLNPRSSPGDAEHIVSLLHLFITNGSWETYQGKLNGYHDFIELAILGMYASDLEHGVLQDQFVRKTEKILAFMGVDVSQVLRALTEEQKDLYKHFGFIKQASAASKFVKTIFEDDFVLLAVDEFQRQARAKVDGLMSKATISSQEGTTCKQQLSEMARKFEADMAQYPVKSYKVQLDICGIQIELPCKSLDSMVTFLWGMLKRNRCIGKDEAVGGLPYLLVMSWAGVTNPHGGQPLSKDLVGEVHQGITWLNNQITNQFLTTSCAINGMLDKSAKHFKSRVCADGAIDIAVMKALGAEAGAEAYAKQLFACIASEGQHTTVAQTLVNWRHLQTSDLYMFLPASVRGGLDGDFEVVKTLQQGLLTKNMFEALSGKKKEFALQCLWACEHVKQDAQVETAVYGSDGLSALIKDLATTPKKNRKPAQLNLMAQFAWAVGERDIPNFTKIKDDIEGVRCMSTDPKVQASKKRKIMKKEEQGETPSSSGGPVSEADSILKEMETWF